MKFYRVLPSFTEVTCVVVLCGLYRVWLGWINFYPRRTLWIDWFETFLFYPFNVLEIQQFFQKRPTVEFAFRPNVAQFFLFFSHFRWRSHRPTRAPRSHRVASRRHFSASFFFIPSISIEFQCWFITGSHVEIIDHYYWYHKLKFVRDHEFRLADT